MGVHEQACCMAVWHRGGPRCYDNGSGVVRCAIDCGALYAPRTLTEALVAVEHWRCHSVDGGCSHGC